MSFLQVDLKRIQDNYHSVKKRLGDTLCYCVVKSDAYGCGLTRVAKTLQQIGASGFVVAEVEEGVALRECGVVVPILVLGYATPLQVEKALHFDLTLSVFNGEYLRELSRGLSNGLTGKKIKVWFKVNCGFNRVGFVIKELSDLLEKNSSLVEKFFCLTGIFAHFREFAFDYERDKYVDNFADFCKFAKKNPLLKNAKTSLLNSGGLRCVTHTFDVARVGASLYGLGNGCEKAHTVAEFYAKVLQINQLHKGQTVGYDDSFVAKKDCYVAVLDVGYADGLPRNAGRLGVQVFYAGKYLPLVGSVCMNHSFVLLEEKPTELGFVELFGKNLSIKSIAEKLGTIDYEILCRFGKNSQRKYLS